MQSQASKTKVYYLTSLILSAIGFALYVLCYLLSDDGSDYFPTGHPLPMLASALSITAVLWFASAMVLIPKNALPTENFTANKICIPAIFPIVGALAAGALCLTYLSPDDLLAVLQRHQPVNAAVICVTLALLGCLLSIAYYLLCMIADSKFANATVVLGIGPIALLTGLCGLTYFELDHHMNAPAKIALQLAWIATMLFLTSEMRLLLGRSQPRRYLASAAVGLFANCCAIAGAVPALINPAEPVHGVRILGFALLCLCNALYIGYRLAKFSAFCNTAATPDPEQTQGEEQQDGCQQQDPMAS